MADSISVFHGRFRFLSNFWPAEVTLDGEQYATVEHAYQASKTADLGVRTMIRSLPYAGAAKQAGKRYASLTLRPDWNDARLEIMQDLLRQKFALPHLRDLLLETGDEKIVESNNWGDTFWGVCNGQGENHMGELLMKIRDELRGSR